MAMETGVKGWPVIQGITTFNQNWENQVLCSALELQKEYIPTNALTLTH